MRVLTFDELDSSLELDRAAIHAAAFGGGFPRRSVEILRRKVGVLADYGGVFAVDQGRLVGQVFVLRIPYAFRDGPGTVSGIAGVATRPDFARRGVARTLLSDVHRREREAGMEYAALWTNRAWIAHGLYESLGYRDVYSSPWAFHAAAAGGPMSGGGILLRPARVRDLALIDRFHDRECRRRLGFYRRPSGNAEASARLGEIVPAKHLLVAERRARIVGYAHVDRNPSRVVCGELVAQSRSAVRALVRGVAREARRMPFAFQHTPVADYPEVFARPGFATLSASWYGMMGARLRGEWSRRAAVSQFATADSRFVCLAGDRF